ncbi:MAG: outer membrane protein assembly factor BamC, partial [Methylococcales bacterium]|nr:outer membrane protein assembly factor BamC [Methylococcales bacterium]
TKKAETIIPAKVSKKTTTPNVAPKETIKPAATTREETDREEETVVMVDMVEGSTAQPASSNLKSYSYDEPTIVTPQSSNLKNYSYDEPVVVTPPSDTTETEPEIKVEPPQEPAEIKKPFYVDFIMFDAGATRLRTNQKFTPIWRLIGKSLSHNHIEITQRNRESGQFIIQYDPDRKDYNDDSVSDEFWFVFSDNNANEKEFRIRVISYNKKIEILVLDESNTPLSDGTGLKILKLIFNTLHSALSAQK